MQIVAVVFANFDNHSKLVFGEKPYFYIDPHDCSVGDLALTYVSKERGCAIVRVVRDMVDDAAAMYVTKPLLCKIDYDPDILKDIQSRIDDFKKKTEEHRVQHEIDARIKEARGDTPENIFPTNPMAPPRFPAYTPREDKTNTTKKIVEKDVDNNIDEEIPF